LTCQENAENAKFCRLAAAMARLMNKEWHMYGMQAYRLERLSGRIRLRMHASGRCGQELLASEHSSLHAKAEKALPHDIFDSLASAPAQTARHIGVVVWAEQALPLFAARLYTASSCSLLGYTHSAALVLRTWGLLPGPWRRAGKINDNEAGEGGVWRIVGDDGSLWAVLRVYRSELGLGDDAHQTETDAAC
jgi:hypothetical protein